MHAALILLVAAVCINEANFDSQTDCQLIWQVTEGHGVDDASRLRWLRRHSGRVSGRNECVRGNCLWTRHLRASGARPRGLPRSAPWDSAWFLRVYGWSADLVEGRDRARPCPGQPQTWDGRRWLARSLERGYERLHCRGTLNEGYRYPTLTRGGAWEPLWPI